MLHTAKTIAKRALLYAVRKSPFLTFLLQDDPRRPPSRNYDEETAWYDANWESEE